MEGRVIEYVDHLHEHFEDPRRSGGRYLAPTRPGYSITMRPESGWRTVIRTARCSQPPRRYERVTNRARARGDLSDSSARGVTENSRRLSRSPERGGIPLQFDD
jgi:hypothetical protein